MPTDEEMGFPAGTSDERELLLRWLAFLRGAVIRKADGLSDEDARWTPDGKLISLLGIVNHLTGVEWRWIDGGMLGHDTTKRATSTDPARSSPWRPRSPPTGSERPRPTQWSVDAVTRRAVRDGATTPTSAGCCCT